MTKSNRNIRGGERKGGPNGSRSRKCSNVGKSKALKGLNGRLTVLTRWRIPEVAIGKIPKGRDASLLDQMQSGVLPRESCDIALLTLQGTERVRAWPNGRCLYPAVP